MVSVGVARSIVFAHPDCDGYEQLTRKLNETDGWIVKVAHAWTSEIHVESTAWYQLNHSSYRAGSKRPLIPVWFGRCKSKGIKLTFEARRAMDRKEFPCCPLCGHELVKLKYLGRKAEMYWDIDGKNELWIDYEENGLLAWIEDLQVH